MNKYLVSVDIEGITGVISKNFSKEDGKYYPRACRYMISDTNAVIQGIIDVDPTAEIVVRDAHGVNATNLDLEYLHPRASLIQGWEAVPNMLTSLDNGFTGVFLVGYHAGGQNIQAVLGHTMHSIIHHVKVNGKLLNETGLFALYAAHYGVPVVFISGDDHTIREAKEQLGSAIVGAVVKKSYGRSCAASLSLEQARRLLAKKAAEAVKKLQRKKIKALDIKLPLTLEIKFYDTGVRVSVLQNLIQILACEPMYKFNCAKRTVTFKTADIMDMMEHLGVVLTLICGTSP